jgi:hypothetical protein
MSRKTSADPNDSLAAIEKSSTSHDDDVIIEALIGVHIQIYENILQHRLSHRNILLAGNFGSSPFPQAVLTLLASVLALMTDSESHFENQLNHAAGILSCFVVFLQTMSSNCSYGTRAAMHEAVVIDLRNLREELKLIMASPDPVV